MMKFNKRSDMVFLHYALHTRESTASAAWTQSLGIMPLENKVVFCEEDRYKNKKNFKKSILHVFLVQFSDTTLFPSN